MKTKIDYPLMNEVEVDYILKNSKKNSTILEWGAGYSTVFFAKHFKQINTIEHDRYWHRLLVNKINANQISNIALLYEPADLNYRVWENQHSRLLDNRVMEFQSYIKGPNKFGKGKYNYIIIDGRARVECAEYALKFCKPDTIVYLQEFYRPRYKQVLEWYDLVEEVDNMAVLRPKPECIGFHPFHKMRQTTRNIADEEKEQE